MLKSFFLMVVFFVAATATVWAKSPAGSFNVVGTNPGGGGKYTGSVTVTPNGDTFQVVWHVGNDTFRGTGLWVDEKLSVGYAAGGEAAIAVYSDQGDGTWFGHWANGSSPKAGTETWTPRR